MKIRKSFQILLLIVNLASHLEIFLISFSYVSYTLIKSRSSFFQYFKSEDVLKQHSSFAFNQNNLNSTTREHIHLSVPLQYRLWEGEQYKNYWFELFSRIPKPTPPKTIFHKADRKTKLEIVLIEPRRGKVHNLIPTLNNIATVYGGTDVAFTFICSKESALLVKHNIQHGWKNIRAIHIGGHFPRIPHYNDMLTSKWFWEYFESKHVLITHTDSFIFRPIDEYLYEYDQIGAPWPHYPEIVGNGGYVFRGVVAMQQTLGIRKPEEIGYILESGASQQNSEAEDVFWATNVKNQPGREIAINFAVEMYSECEIIPTGAHQIDRFGGTFECTGDYWRFWESKVLSLY